MPEILKCFCEKYSFLFIIIHSCPYPEVGDWNEALWPPQPVATRYVGVDGVLRRAACAATRWAGDIAVVCAYFPGATLPVTENCPPRAVLENFSEPYWAHVRRQFPGAPCLG